MVQQTFQQIWKQMDLGRRRQAATAFFADSETEGQRRGVVGFIAKKLNLRPQKAAKFPADKAAAYLASIESLDEPLAAWLIRSYLFASQQAMLLMFLDELKIPHQNGVIPEGNTAVPTVDELRAAVERIRGAFLAEDVQLYLSALIASGDATWTNLAAEVPC
jgi:hypothetical protein